MLSTPVFRHRAAGVFSRWHETGRILPNYNIMCVILFYNATYSGFFVRIPKYFWGDRGDSSCEKDRIGIE